MTIYPAIDIRGERCVRLYKGDFSREEVFSDDPAAVAKKWEEAGARWLHIVDLDGARAGHLVNGDAIGKILSTINIPAELGGGIRTMDDIERALAMGIRRVILGSVAVNDPTLVALAVKRYGERIAVGIDARDGIVQVAGWEASGGVDAVDFAKKMSEAGVMTLIHTDVSRDGTLTGANVAASVEIAKASGASVIVSGGVSSVDDIVRVKRHEAEGLAGVIVGKALYTGAVELCDALAAGG